MLPGENRILGEKHRIGGETRYNGWISSWDVNMSLACLQGLTDVGCVRSVNEDCFLIQPLSKSACSLNSDTHHDAVSDGFLVAVADGMGGAAAGEVASSMALTTLRDHILENRDALQRANSRQIVAIVEEGIHRANNAIWEAAQANPDQKGMGATITACFVRGETAFLFQVGDSRAYAFRGEGLFRLTRDQSFVSHLMEMGTLTEEQAAKHPQRNVILQALGTRPELVVDVSYLPLCRGDMLMLCSDGLHGEYPGNSLQTTFVEVYAARKELRKCVERLVQGAKDGGGHDNISVVAVVFGDEDLPERQPGEDPAYLPFPFLERDNPIREIFKMLH